MSSETYDVWVQTLIEYASGPSRPQRDAAIRALWIQHGFTVEDINEVCSVDLATVRWALTHAPVIRTTDD
jgi:ribosomal protein S11